MIGFVDVTGREGYNVGWDVISWFQDSPIVHVFLAFELAEGWVVYETSETVFGKRPLTERLTGNKCHLFYIGETDKINVVPAQSFCETLIGKTYDYTGIAGLGLVLAAERLANLILWPVKKALAWFGNNKLPDFRFIIMPNPLQLNSAYFCTESTIIALKAAGLLNNDGHWLADAVPPRDLYTYIRDNPRQFPPAQESWFK
jgi:hypothetical protein